MSVQSPPTSALPASTVDTRCRADALPQAVRAVYPWDGHLLDADGGQLHYIDEGPRDAPVLLCVHGNPTWSFYWRSVIARFAGEFRVIVPDHIGCGLSDKPQDWAYQLKGHVDNLERLVDHLGIQEATFVVHDWGGAIGSGLATRRPDMVQAMVVTNTAAWRSTDIPPSIASCRIPGFGPLAVRGFNGFAWVATVRAVHKRIAPVAKQGLLYPYKDWASRIATLRFVEDIPLKPAHPSYAELARIDDALHTLADKPMLICWGDDDFCFHPGFRTEWERRFPQAQVHNWADVGHYVCEDAPDRLLPLMAGFLSSLGSSRP